MKKNKAEITVYDDEETTTFINKKNPLKLADIGFKLPKESPTKVISIRLPTELYNKIRAYSTNLDIPYQAYIKLLLNNGIKKTEKFNSK